MNQNSANDDMFAESDEDDSSEMNNEDDVD